MQNQELQYASQQDLQCCKSQFTWQVDLTFLIELSMFVFDDEEKFLTTEIPEFLWVIVVDLFVSKPHSCNKKSNKL